jgi:hypothetical protein
MGSNYVVYLQAKGEEKKMFFRVSTIITFLSACSVIAYFPLRADAYTKKPPAKSKGERNFVITIFRNVNCNVSVKQNDVFWGHTGISVSVRLANSKELIYKGLVAKHLSMIDNPAIYISSNISSYYTQVINPSFIDEVSNGSNDRFDTYCTWISSTEKLTLKTGKSLSTFTSSGWIIESQNLEMERMLGSSNDNILDAIKYALSEKGCTIEQLSR